MTIDATSVVLFFPLLYFTISDLIRPSVIFVGRRRLASTDWTLSWSVVIVLLWIWFGLGIHFN
jgi:hypothetical protein